MDGSTAPVQTTQTTIRVIEALQELDEAGVSEIADYLEIPTSTAFDHLRTLEQYEFVVNNHNGYSLGTRFLRIGGHSRSTNELYRTAQPEIRKMARKTGEHANLMVKEFGKGVFLAKEEGEDAFQLDTYIGKRVSLQTTAAGKAMLSTLPDDAVEEIIDRHGLPAITENTITDRETLFKELDEIYERGFATDDEERIRGVRCVGAPLTDSNDEVIGAVSISGPKSGIQDKRFKEEIPNLVSRTANVIEVNLKYQ